MNSQLRHQLKNLSYSARLEEPQETIRLAAMAAGLWDSKWVWQGTYQGFGSPGLHSRQFNPMRNKADAFDLMTALNLEVRFFSSKVQIRFICEDDAEHIAFEEPYGGKTKEQALMMALTCAAATMYQSLCAQN